VGSLDVGLSNEGVEQIKTLSPFFDSKELSSIISSPMRRCRETSEILFSKEPIVYDDDLREIDFGEWEGLTFQEIVNRYPQQVEQWAHWSLDFCFPGGECTGDFLNRVHRAAQRITEFPQGDLLLIGHGGVIRALLCYFLQLDPSEYLLFQVKKARIAQLKIFDKGALLTGLNLGG
jgi:broad specificity phosphatase PhoE